MSNYTVNIDWLREHAEALDKNWHQHHNACLSRIKAELEGCETTNLYGKPTVIGSDPSISEICGAIRRLRQGGEG